MAGDITTVAIAEAVAETEKEVFDDALGNEPLEQTGDRSLEDMDDGSGDGEPEQSDAGDDEGAQAEGGEKPEAQAGSEQPRDPKGQFAKADGKPGVPPGRLKEESDKRRAAESKAGDLQSRFDTLQKQFDALQAGLNQRQQPQQQQQQQQQQPQIPDKFADPEAYDRWVIATANQTATNRFINASLDDARESAGAEKFGEAYSELMQIGEAEKQQFGTSPTVARIYNAANPGRTLMTWHKERSAMREIGNDPQAWLAKQLEAKLNDPEFLAQAVERARTTAKNNGASTTRLPPSLNSQTGASQHQGNGDPNLYDNSEESVMAFALK